MRKLYAILILIMFSNSFFGQHSALTSNYLLNIFSINPAYAGQRRAVDMTLFYRKQWLGTTGSPQTASILGSMEVKPKNLSIGFQFINDNIDSISDFGNTYKGRISWIMIGFRWQDLSKGICCVRRTNF